MTLQPIKRLTLLQIWSFLLAAMTSPKSRRMVSSFTDTASTTKEWTFWKTLQETRSNQSITTLQQWQIWLLQTKSNLCHREVEVVAEQTQRLLLMCQRMQLKKETSNLLEVQIEKEFMFIKISTPPTQNMKRRKSDNGLNRYLMVSKILLKLQLLSKMKSLRRVHLRLSINSKRSRQNSLWKYLLHLLKSSTLRKTKFQRLKIPFVKNIPKTKETANWYHRSIRALNWISRPVNKVYLNNISRARRRCIDKTLSAVGSKKKGWKRHLKRLKNRSKKDF